ncbi:hypothetical protein BCR35DRAFT_303785 [Leucosporidium creatinivorum]|uniref:Histone deacetylase interacting domain-containing protein n=1 Tax=Leucosporidium creatinivorum TaxID=106004 RepID=A0A1Y2FEM8_9BASI|nr:hypothetical protein BCR35DRAFT_303785 [Leucosporidium creatinivorum]
MAAQPPPSTGGIPPTTSTPTQSTTATAPTTTANRFPAAPATAPPAPAAQPFRPLNVKDALSYLDRVKVTFNDQAEVYDRFLTIMKEFKSQGIDTPGVIERVSTLFRGHPALIQGFNTFLPPGYRIECSVGTSQEEGGGVTTITVTTPMGMTTRTQVTGTSAAPASTSTPARAPGASTAPVLKPTAAPSSSSSSAQKDGKLGAGAAGASTARSPIPAAATKPTDSAFKDPLHLPSIPAANLAAHSSAQPIATPGAASLLSNHLSAPAAAASTAAPAAAGASVAQVVGGVQATATSTDPQGARPPMEFNHAINYVNKIKNRFVRDPDTYKAFLEILQTYQKEGRAIQDVYAQVTTLFHGAPDLLDEFKQFLPDTSGDAGAAPPGGLMGAGAPRGAGGASKRPASSVAGQKRDEQASAKKPKVSKKVEEKNKPIKRVSKPDGKDVRKPAASESLYSDGLGADPMGYGHPHMTPYGQGYPIPGYPPHQPVAPVAYAYEAPPPPPPPQPLLPPKPLASSADMAFFNRVKIHTNDTPTYHEFLKLLNLYTQDIIDLTALVSRAYLFLGQDQNLWKEFREIVGWTEGKAVGDPGHRVEVVDGVRIIENVPALDGPKRGAGDDGKGYKTYGPSYRQLPQSEISLNCSGRDALCWDVLNDEWVSQPSWASDEGFVANRKNPFEEAMHRSEEERHEYDYHIEANLRTIALLEPIATRIAIMEADERATFRLKPGLGNQSKSIYQRVIKKVYGKEQGLEVIQALHENPCVAVPIVLARLKQKDDEWKRALREWNRVWRESDAKNFWKSLDHQGIAQKANDKRVLTNKALVTEIETIKRAQKQRAAGFGRPLSSPLTAQFVYDVSDREAIFDSTRLLFSYLDRANGFSNNDKDKIDAFLRNFLPLLFALAPTEFALELLPVGGEGDDLESIEGVSDAGTSALGDVSEITSVVGSTTKRGGKKAAADLRKKALKNAGGPGSRGGAGGGRRSKVSSPAPSSRDASPAPSTGADTPAADTVMTDAMPTITSLASLITPEVEAEIAANREQSSIVDSSREASAMLGGDDATRSPSIGPGGESMERGDSAMSMISATESIAAPLPSTLPDGPLPELIIPVDDKPSKVETRRQWNLFANSNLYCLIRLFQTLYSRLSSLKHSSIILATPPPPQPITAQHVPSLSLSLTMAPERKGEPMSVTAQQYYQRALGLCEKLFDGEIDQAAFEEAMRTMFATQGYTLFTVDKLLNMILKQCQSALSDSKTRDLVDLLRQDRSHPDRSTPQQQTFYRTQAETALGNDENLYRIEWVPNDKRMSVQLLGKDSIAQEELVVVEREWARYLANYVLAEPTPGVSEGPNGKPFLSRNLRRTSPSGVDVFPSQLSVTSALQSKICMRSYRLFFVPHTEDLLLRHGVPTPTPSSPAKKERFEAFVEKRMEELKPVLVEKEREREVERKRKEEEERVAREAAQVKAREEEERVKAAAAVAEEQRIKAEEEAKVAAAAAPTPAPIQAEEVKPAEVAPIPIVAEAAPTTTAEAAAIPVEAPTTTAAEPLAATAPVTEPAPAPVDEDVKMSDA